METKEMKRCRCCDLLLPIDQFSEKRWRSKNGTWVYGLYGHCKKCIKARHDKYRKEHPDYWVNYYLKQQAIKHRDISVVKE